MSTGLSIAVAACLAIAAAVVAWTVKTLRRAAVILNSVEERLSAETPPPGLRSGSHVPFFTAVSADGNSIPARELLQGRVVILFLRQSCFVCRTLAAELSPMRYAQLVVVLRDSREREVLSIPDDVPVIFQPDGAVAFAFKTGATPHAFLVEDEYVVHALFPNSLADLQELEVVGLATGRPPLGSAV